MDPITLATVTSILTVIATECGKGIADAAGKDIWSKAKKLLGLSVDPTLSKLPVDIATKIHGDEELMAKLISLLQAHSSTDAPSGIVGPLVKNLQAKNVSVAGKIDNVHMS